jgi:diphosphomevalonate decarboxylase
VSIVVWRFVGLISCLGFVEWEAGVLEDGSDSLARQVAPRSHWPEMKAMICVVSDREKDVSSSSGMQTSVETSELMVTRVGLVVPKRIEAIKKAIMERDFER